MARRNKSKKREINPDSRYNSILLTRLINTIMKSGEKSIAEKIVYNALSLIEKENMGESVLLVFETAVENVTPSVEVRSKRVGGSTYQVPVPVRKDRAISLALRWIVKSSSAARENTKKSTSDCLFSEIFDAYNKRGRAFEICKGKYKMAEANKAFSHLRF